MTIDISEWVTVGTASRMLGISHQAIYKQTKIGKLKRVKIDEVSFWYKPQLQQIINHKEALKSRLNLVECN